MQLASEPRLPRQSGIVKQTIYCVKENQSCLHQDISLFFGYDEQKDFKGGSYDYTKSVN